MSYIEVETRGSAFVLTLNDSPRRNVLSAPMCAELSAAIQLANRDPAARAVIITGRAPAFCAGAVLEDLQAAARGETGPIEAVYRSFMDVAMSPLPTVAAVNGPAVGAGFNLALACDVRVAADSALFDTRFLKLGLHPGGGHTWMLVRAVGWSQASRLLMGGLAVDAAEAERIGLVVAVVSAVELVEQAMSAVSASLTAPRELITRAKGSLRLAADSNHLSSFNHEAAEQRWSLAQSAFSSTVNHPKRS